MKIGDYVNATLVGGINGESRTGVYVSDNGDGTIQVRGEGDVYQCTKDAVVIPDSNLFSDTLAFVQAVRKQLEA
jgi:hypothetical protein